MCFLLSLALGSEVDPITTFWLLLQAGGGALGFPNKILGPEKGAYVFTPGSRYVL